MPDELSRIDRHITVAGGHLANDGKAEDAKYWLQRAVGATNEGDKATPEVLERLLSNFLQVQAQVILLCLRQGMEENDLARRFNLTLADLVQLRLTHG